MTQQQAFQAVKNLWNAHNWTPAETALWQHYCGRNPIRNYIGEKRFMFPYQGFLSVNIPRYRNGMEVLYIPPES